MYIRFIYKTILTQNKRFKATEEKITESAVGLTKVQIVRFFTMTSFSIHNSL